MNIESILCQLLRIGSVGVGAPDANLIRAVMKGPCENDVAVAAGGESWDPGVQVAQRRVLDSTTLFEAPHTLAIRDEQCGIAHPSEGNNVMGLGESFRLIALGRSGTGE